MQHHNSQKQKKKNAKKRIVRTIRIDVKAFCFYARSHVFQPQTRPNKRNTTTQQGSTIQNITRGRSVLERKRRSVRGTSRTRPQANGLQLTSRTDAKEDDSSTRTTHVLRNERRPDGVRRLVRRHVCRSCRGPRAATGSRQIRNDS